MYLHRVTANGFTHAVLSPDDKPLVEVKDKKDITLFSWSKNFVSPWRDFVGLFPNVSACLKWGVTLNWGTSGGYKWNGAFVYRYPVIPEIKSETHIPCVDPPYLMTSAPLCESWAEDIMNNPVGLTGTSLAKVTISREGWESVVPGGSPWLEPGAGPVRINFSPSIPFDTCYWIEDSDGKPVCGFDVCPPNYMMGEPRRVIDSFQARHGKTLQQLIVDGDVSPTGECCHHA